MRPSAFQRWFRPAAYSLILVLVALAVFAQPAPGDPAENFVRASPAAAIVEREAGATSEGAIAPLPAVTARASDAFAADLFVASAPPPPAPVDVVPVAAPIPELKVLGWLESDAAPQVFVDLGGETFSLSPGQAAADVFRFDSIGAGLARFTYLPTGDIREFAVTDPELSE